MEKNIKKKVILTKITSGDKIGKRKKDNTGVIPAIRVKSSCSKCRKNGKLFCPITTSCSC
ncbi:MAG: hypothetical protein OIF36_03745 [Alphaproteobacteria bacterium]|nr:hypothetical protein [Alphaproteobacteria bacterium]